MRTTISRLGLAVATLGLLLATLATSTKAQTVVLSATFAYGPIQSNNCSSIAEWNGVPNAYPDAMGVVCFNFYPNPYSGIEIPWQLGFPNDGLLLQNTPFTWGPIVWTTGDGTHDGDTFSQTGTAAYTGYGAGVTVSVNNNFIVHITRSCYRGVCRNFTTHTLTGGTGVAYDIGN